MAYNTQQWKPSQKEMTASVAGANDNTMNISNDNQIGILLLTVNYQDIN